MNAPNSLFVRIIKIPRTERGREDGVDRRAPLMGELATRRSSMYGKRKVSPRVFSFMQHWNDYAVLERLKGIRRNSNGPNSVVADALGTLSFPSES